MINRQKSSITGVGAYVPEYILTNEMIERMVDTHSDWILSRTGIKERRILKGDGKGTSVMGVKAVNILLEKTNTNPKEVDLIICATVTPDMLFPATANIIARETGATNSYSFDMGAACSGFLYALVTGTQFIETGIHKKVVVVGADKMSSLVDYTDRRTCIIFGDGAGAVLLEPAENENAIIDFSLHVNGNGEKHLHMKAGGSRLPASHETVNAKAHYIYQEGQSVFRHAVDCMSKVVSDIMKKNGLTADTIDFLVPHQANKRIIDATRKKANIPEEKVMVNIHRYANTTAATIPLCLWDYEQQIKKGDNLVLAAFGGGFTWGALYLKWAY